MALDNDASGYIALTEIKPRCATSLAEFRRWANLFFGSVMSAFMVLDVDGGGSLSRTEFKKSVTKYCFHGDREELFSILDIGGDGDINVEEMAFLDEWEYTEVCDEPVPSFMEVEALLKRHVGESDDEAEQSEEEDQSFDPHDLLKKRGAAYLKEHQLPVHASQQVHRPMPGSALVELLGGLDSPSRSRFGSSPVHSQYSPSRSRFESSPNTTSCFSTSDVLPSMLSVSSPRGGSELYTASTSRSPRKNRSLRQVPYIGGTPLMKRPTRAVYGSTSGSGPSNFSLPLFI